MDNKNVIYLYTNKINGKMYVGKTNNFKRRHYRHFHDEDCIILKKAFDKYGIENFEMLPIVTFTAINRDVLDKVLNFLECFYIKKYNTFINGYNATIGGEGRSGYTTTKETREKISKAKMGHACSEHVKKTNRKCLTDRELWKLSEKPVLQYDLDGRFYRKYESIAQAADALINDGIASGKSTSVRCSIGRALNGCKYKKNYKTAYGYLWIYENPKKFELFIEEFSLEKDKPLFHYSKEGALIESYRNVREASRKTGITKSNLNYMASNGDKYRKLYKTKKKDYWSRTAPQ